MVGVAKRSRQRIVIPPYVGPNPTIYPSTYARLAQWIEHLATNQGFVGVRVPHRVPIILFEKIKKILYNIYRK